MKRMDIVFDRQINGSNEFLIYFVCFDPMAIRSDKQTNKFIFEYFFSFFLSVCQIQSDNGINMYDVELEIVFKKTI